MLQTGLREVAVTSVDKVRWLRKEGGEWKWAYEYMKRNAYRGIKIRINYAQNKRQPSHETCLDVIRYLGETEDGRDFIRRLRDSLRQYRKRRSTTDRTVCTFTLPTKTKKRLSSTAKALNVSESSIVTTVLDQTEKLLDEYRRREENMHEIQRKKLQQRINLLQAKHHEAMRQIQKLATRLSIWELAMKAEHPGTVVDQERLDSAAKEKTKDISKVIKQAVSQSTLLLPRT